MDSDGEERNITMGRKLIFVTGVGIGYVLGTRAGREKFDRMAAQAHKFWESPTVQEAAGVVQAQAHRLYDDGRHAIAERVRSMSGRNESGRAHMLPPLPDEDSVGDADEGLA